MLAPLVRARQPEEGRRLSLFLVLFVLVTLIALIPIDAAYSASSTPANGLVAAYGFEEGSETTVADASGNNNTGTISGAAWTRRGKFGNALSFGGNAWVTISDAPSLDLLMGMTLMAWVYPTAKPTSQTAVIVKEQPGDLVYALFAASSNKRPRASIYLGATRSVTAPAALPLDTWSHLAATYDNATVRLYVNGILVASRSVSGSLPVSTRPLRLGGDSIDGSYFTGRIDEIRIYNRALTATEIQTDMQTAVATVPPPSTTATLTVVPAGTGAGTVTSSPAGINCGTDCSESYLLNTTVILTATPAAGSTFSGWSGPCTGTGSCTLTLTQAQTVGAIFDAPVGGIPFGPFHFGDRTTDYTYVKDGVTAGDVFTGAFISLRPTMSTATAQSLLAAARSNGNKVIISAANSDPCYFWDGATFNQSQFVADVAKSLPSIAAYQDVVVGMILLNEPHDPSYCAPIPASVLYNAARALRAQFATYGLPATFPLGYGAYPAYFETVAADGTINLSNAQYTPSKGTIQNYVSSQQASAANVGHKLYFTVNAERDGADLTADLDYMCKNADPTRTLMVGYWKWTSTGGNQTVPLSSLVKVRDSCAAR